MEDDMGVLATNDRQLTLIYSSTSSLGKQTLGYVRAAGDKIQTVDVAKTALGNTAWVDIADGLNMSLGELLAGDHPDAISANKADFDTDDWLKLLKKNPDLLRKPIAINGKKYLQVDTPSEVLKFFGVDSAGLEKKSIGNPPTTQPKSDSDRFV